MTYALGLELAPDAVRVATMTEPTAYDGPLEVHPPVLLCEGGQTWFGATAVAYGRDRPNALVEDVVGQFTVDRIFLTAGRMLTPDDALRELLWGIVSELGGRRGEMPGAVSIACPGLWSADTCARVETIAHAVGLASVRLATATDCYLAASDAFARLPRQQAVAPTVAVEVPALESTFKRPREAPVPGVVATPHVTEVKSSRPAIIGAVVAIVVIIAVLGLVIARNAGADTEPSSPSTSVMASATARSAPGPRSTAAVDRSSPQPAAPRGRRGER